MSSSGAIRAGRAFVELFVEDNKVYRALDKVKGYFLSTAKTLARIGAGLGGAGSSLLAPLLAGLDAARDRGNTLGLLSARIGETVEDVSVLAHAFDRAGVGLDQFGSAVETLKANVAAAARENRYFSDEIRSLGHGRDLANLPLSELFDRVAAAVRRGSGPMEQLKIATLAFGDAGRDLLPFLKDASKSFADYRAEAQAAGAVLSPEQADQARTLTRVIADGWREVKNTFIQVGLSLLPTATALAGLGEAFSAGMRWVREWIAQNRGLVIGLAATAAGLIAAGVAAVGMAGLFVGAAAAISAGITLVTAAAAALEFVLSPIGLIIVAAGGAAVALGALGYVIATQTQAGREAVAALGDAFGALADRVGLAWAGISDAIDAGDWSLALEIALAALELEWAKFFSDLQFGWNVAKDVLVDGWKDFGAIIRKVFIDLAAFILRNTVGTARDIADKIARVIGLVDSGLANSIREVSSGLLSDDEINAGRDAAKSEIDTERQRDRNQRWNARAAAQSEADEAARAAEARLKSLREWAATEWAQWDDDEDSRDTAKKGAAGHPAAWLSERVKGLFSGPVGQQLGYGDTLAQQQLDATRTLVTNTTGLPQLPQAIGAAVGQALRIGK